MTEHDDLDAVGRRLGYTLLRVLGSGGFGTVYLARQSSLDRLCAVKVLARELGADPAFRARFEREGRAASRLDHPNLVTVYDQGERSGLLYIVMQYVEGENLREILERESPLHPGRALALMSQAAAAVDAIHEAGLIHRDIKPENFLVRRRNGRDEVLLTDFGIASFDAEPSRFTSTDVGLLLTPQYAAPERWSGGQGEYATDLYALACVLFECLAGQPPFVRPTSAALCLAHVNDAPPDLDEVQPGTPSGLAAVVAMGLAKDPRQRWGSAAAMLDAARQSVNAARTTEPRGARPVAGSAGAATFVEPPSGSSAPTYRPVRTPTSASSTGRRLLITAAVLVVAALLIGGGAYALNATRSPLGVTPLAQDTPTAPASASSTGTTGDNGASPASRSSSGVPTASSANGSSTSGPAAAATPETPVGSGTESLNSWIAQLASIRLGQPSELDARFRQIAAVYPQAKVLRSDDFASLTPGYWVVYAAADFNDGASALIFCHQFGFAVPHDCLGRYLSQDPTERKLFCSAEPTTAADRCHRHGAPA